VPAGISHVHDWLSQSLQYLTRTDIPKAPGIVHWTVPKNEAPVRIECLLFFDEDVQLRGILNYYPEGSAFGDEPHDTLTLVHPAHRRKGIGTALLKEATCRWPQIDLTKQSYTDEGWALAQTLL
jgi:GNAT superfamily N-acetyltransferase